jgi:hypothetical protein
MQWFKLEKTMFYTISIPLINAWKKKTHSNKDLNPLEVEK